MTKHIRTAVHSIEYNDEKTGEPLTAAPGVTFDVPDKQLKDLEDAGAIRESTSAEEKAFRDANPVPHSDHKPNPTAVTSTGSKTA